jgi:hypothetical protein
MTIADNGAAIIDGEVVPAREVEILRALAVIGTPATVGAILVQSGQSMSYQTAYSLLRRLNKERGLVTREMVHIQDHLCLKRCVLWSASATAKKFFRDMSSDITTSKS